MAECVPVDLGDAKAMAELAGRVGADLTVVGPEQPLVAGVADEFAARRLAVVGPSKACAQLEGSKVFAKEFLNRHAIPTAACHGVFSSAVAARTVLKRVGTPVVLKADGLCAGKGVLVASSPAEAEEFIDRVLEQREFGDGGSRLMIEETLSGPELSFIVLSDGERYAPLVPTRDHKRALDNDRGPNTGGMGAYSAEGMISAALEKQILKTVVEPTMNGLAADGRKYRGFLYFGLMLTTAGPKVLEFNCRLGDPEAQAIMARVDFDLAETLRDCAEGRLDEAKFKWRSGASLCVVMASGGYPGKFATQHEIYGIDLAESIPGVAVFHAGTQRKDGRFYTSGGRVLGVTAAGSSIADARETVYQAVERISFAEMHYRRDIALAAVSSAKAAES